MDAKLFLALLIEKGESIPDRAYKINVYGESVTFETEQPFTKTDWRGREYQCNYLEGTIIFENDVLGDDWEIEFEDNEFTVEEFNQWLVNNPNAVAEHKALQRSVVVHLSELAVSIEQDIEEGKKLAKSVGLPFSVKLGGSPQDVRKLDHVDWDSSSMYC